MSRKGNPASRVVRRKDLRPSSLSPAARRLLVVIGRIGPVHVADAGNEAGLSERGAFFAASELLERDAIVMTPEGLRRRR